MAITSWPNDVMLEGTVTCTICGAHVRLADVTAGFHDCNDVQLFACNLHFWSGSALYGGWAASPAKGHSDISLAPDQQSGDA